MYVSIAREDKEKVQTTSISIDNLRINGKKRVKMVDNLSKIWLFDKFYITLRKIFKGQSLVA